MFRASVGVVLQKESRMKRDIARKIRCVVCKINERPYAAELTFEEIVGVLGDQAEFVLPSTARAWGAECPLGKGTVIIVGGNARVRDNPPLPNRFGILGNIVVAGTNGHSLPDKQVSSVIEDVKTYDAQEMGRSFRIPVGATFAPSWERMGKKWNPQAHLTGDLRDASEIRFVNYLLLRYAARIVAFAAMRTFGSMYSLELQFAATDEGKSQARSFIGEYEAGFNDGGLKPAASQAVDEYLRTHWEA
jgi:hypothetical protein